MINTGMIYSWKPEVGGTYNYRDGWGDDHVIVVTRYFEYGIRKFDDDGIAISEHMSTYIYYILNGEEYCKLLDQIISRLTKL